jgi:CheY-like chemotaxis protein
VAKLVNSGKTRVLIVDDEQLIADTLALILEKSGFESEAAYSGANAVEKAIILRPDVLISDVVMEGMSGIEAAIRILANLPGCRIILFSGNAATSDMVEIAAAGGHRFELISKPVHPRVLLDHLTGPQLSMTM